MASKKQTRSQFRKAVLERDKYRCRCCNKPGKDRQGGDDWKQFNPRVIKPIDLDVHHITSRDLLENGGYIPENGISVCDKCHLKAEAFWSTGVAETGFEPDDLYEIIGSNAELARLLSELMLAELPIKIAG